MKEAAGQRAVHTPLCPILRRCPGPMRARIKELGSQSTKLGPAPVRPPQGLPRAGRAVCHRPPSALFLFKKKERERESSNPHSRFSPCQRGLQAWANAELEPPCHEQPLNVPEARTVSPTSLGDPPHKCMPKKGF